MQKNPILTFCCWCVFNIVTSDFLGTQQEAACTTCSWLDTFTCAPCSRSYHYYAPNKNTMMRLCQRSGQKIYEQLCCVWRNECRRVLLVFSWLLMLYPALYWKIHQRAYLHHWGCLSSEFCACNYRKMEEKSLNSFQMNTTNRSHPLMTSSAAVSPSLAAAVNSFLIIYSTQDDWETFSHVCASKKHLEE